MDSKAMKEVHDILAGCKNRTDLRTALHVHFEFSVDRARHKIREWFESPASAPPGTHAELTRTAVARKFREASNKEAARLEFLRHVVSRRARWEADKAVPYVPQRLANGKWAIDDEQWSAQFSNRQKAAEQEIAERMLNELEQQIAECKTGDELESLLVRLDWPDKQIRQYMETYGPRTK